MSTDATLSTHSELNTINIDILRYSIGVVLPVIIMVFFQWEMAYITPTLVTLMLAPTSPKLTSKVIKSIVLALVGALCLGIVLTRLVATFPLVALIGIGWSLYLIFYRAIKGDNLLITVIWLMSVLAYPSMAALDINLSIDTALGVTIAFLLAMVCSVLVQFVFPPQSKISLPKAELKNATARKIAGLNTLVLLPIIAAFLMFDLQVAMLTLIYVGILVLSSDLQKGIRACMGVLLANLLGGIIAIICFELLVMVPIAPFYVLLMFFVISSLARAIFTSEKGALLASALSCLMLLLTDVTNTTGFDMDYAFYERWLFIALANLYVVGCFMVLTAIGWLKMDSNT
ncbi:DUF2955 domain-containing protein [Vibrio comitans]|uniref:DUF2955 domain-containing protein n=1 Tax=Vibrio comitans NBRC 102076 TaxID=1219078 RepID=A0A4Y3IH88_9VIBR|nr:DUF2955 domain-containing protein [Vibrio comitans]GEA58843.1 hypothetical protein VCO01S_00360 [Vibrio comitans NBRC 102076]